jgi:hypothetical protein
MTANPFDRDRLLFLAEQAVEGRLAEGERDELERIVLSDAAARREYANYLAMHSALRWPMMPAGEVSPAARRSSRSRWVYLVAGLAAAILLALFFVPRSPQAVATLTDTKACLWDSGTLPTVPGSQLPPGRLRLASGLAQLTFASGAELTLEGPIDLEIVSPMKCIVHSGQLSAKVPPTAQGFIVETPSSVLTDLGTEFGVKVHGGATADVQVFSGRVDVLHRQSGQTAAMLTGAGMRFSPESVKPFNPNTDSTTEVPPVNRPPAGTETLQLTTALGKGRDAFVMDMDSIPADRQSDTLLLVKLNGPKQSQWDRKGYLGIDLTPVRSKHILEAELSLTFAPTGMGFASLCPDATFAVYGLTDDAQDGWDERSIKWKSAPANRPGSGLDPASIVKLGTFVMPQGQQTGSMSIGGAVLADFLNRDANRFATFIIVRVTIGKGGMDLVHGIASRRHPNLPPPTLRLTLSNRP